MDLLVRFPRPSRTQAKNTSRSMFPSQFVLSNGLTNLFEDFYNANLITARFLNLFRVQPLSILAPIQRRQAGRGG
jgi:hypothetical protein